MTGHDHRLPQRARITTRVGRRGEAGFTLVELLVMLAILALLAALIGPRVIGYIGS